MARNSGNASHAASLKQRQLNGINKIASSRRDAPTYARPNNRIQRPNVTGQEAKSKSLLDRMTSPPATKSAAPSRDETSASPRKRKRQKNKQRDSDQVEEESKDPPAKRQKPEDTTIAQATAHQETARKPFPWNHIKSKQQITPKTNPSHRSTPVACLNNKADSEDSYPSPPSELPVPAQSERSTEEIKEAKQACRAPHTTITMQPVDAATAKEREAYLKPSAPTVANPDCEHSYKQYGNDSIPLLFSIEARDGRVNVLLNDPSLDLQCRAIALLEHSNGFAAHDLGRPNVTKKGRTKIINNIDLYLMEDLKVYVGTERGLLLVADYLKLAGVPDTTPVRFNGIKPAYVKASPLNRFRRWVSITTCDPSAEEHERAKMAPGELPLLYGEMVEVWEVDQTCNYQPDEPLYAFGKLIHDGQTGWFDLRNTVTFRKDLPPPEPWDKPMFEEKDFLFSRNDPPASAAQLASLKYVKTYVSPRTAPPLQAAPAVSPAPRTPVPPTNLRKDLASNSGTPSKSIHPTSNEAPKEAKYGAQASPSSTNDEAKSIDRSSSEAAGNGAEKIKKDVKKKEIATPMKDTSEDTASPNVQVKEQDVEKEENATSNASSSKSPVRTSMREHCAEDELDWGDEEL